MKINDFDDEDFNDPISLLEAIKRNKVIDTDTPVDTSIPFQNSKLKEYFESKGLNTIDKRDNGGCLWVIGDESEIGDIVNFAMEEYGVSGRYGAGKQTKGRAGWWTKDKK